MQTLSKKDGKDQESIQSSTTPDPACADPGIFVRGGGGGGGPGQSDKKKALTTFFFLLFSPQLILQKSNGQFQRNLSFFKVPEGVQHFPGGGGGPTFSRGVQ